MELNQTSSDSLRVFLQTYEEIVEQLNKAIEEQRVAQNNLFDKKSSVTKLKYELDLVKEHIMCEKKIIDAGR